MTKNATYGSPGRDWMRRAAEVEDRCESVTVGGLASDLGMLGDEADARPKVLGRLVELRRRDLGFTDERLAEKAGLELSEIRLIEQDDESVCSLRVLYKVADALDLPPEVLGIAAGLVQAREADEVAEATMQFAAKSSTAKPSREERRAMEEFVKSVVKSTRGK